MRHLYPQEKSLKGFMNAILYKNKTYPGIMRNCRFSKYIKKNIEEYTRLNNIFNISDIYVI
ncbi:MAG: hypothetical protein J7K21_02335, partial [Desulfurococcales archaeon]|nr:hypothetical protein [Desulfurococcales archaeon]